jgi:nickel transport protein
MTTLKRSVMIAVLCFLLGVLPCVAFAQSVQEESTQDVITLLKDQNRKLSGDLRRIQREIAALRAELEEPGLKDVFAGIGYIFGLFGVAAFVAARRKE